MAQSPSYLDVMKWTDAECRDYLIAQRWPNGIACPRCGTLEPWTITRKSKTKNKVTTLWKCRGCKKQFSATVGTIFEDSKIPLSKWFAAIYMMVQSKKGVSAHQIHRQLGVTYKSAWYMCHRIREAMREKGPRPILTGTIEADETYVGGKARGAPMARSRRKFREGQASGIKDKQIVFGLLQRGGEARTIVIPNVKSATTRESMAQHIDFSKAELMTDGHSAYRRIRHFMPHGVVDHEREYVNSDDPTVHTQGIENYWSLLKRGLIGTFHHVDAAYLPQYLHEFEFRFNRRDLTDADRFQALLGRTNGRLTWYQERPSLRLADASEPEPAS